MILSKIFKFRTQDWGIDFLVASSKSLETIANQMPDFSILLEEVGLSVPVAFQLVRPLCRAALQ